MSEKPTAKEASTLYDEGMLNVSSFLVVLRDEAANAAEQLWEEITRLQNVLTEANRTHSRLSFLANNAEQAAKREYEEEEVRDDGFIAGAVWAHARVTPTQEQIASEIAKHFRAGDEVDGTLYCGCGEGDYGDANHVAEAVAALLAGLGERESNEQL